MRPARPRARAWRRLRRSRPGVLADLSQGGAQRLAEAARTVGCEMRDHARAGPPDLLQRQHHPQLAHAAAVAVVDHGHGPGGGRPLVVVGGMVVERIGNRPSHPRNPTLRSPSRVASLRSARLLGSLRYAPLAFSGRFATLRSPSRIASLAFSDRFARLLGSLRYAPLMGRLDGKVALI